MFRLFRANPNIVSETNGFENETGSIGLRPAIFLGPNDIILPSMILSILSWFDSVFCKPQMTTEAHMMLVYSVTLHVKRQTNIWPLAKERPNEKHVFAMGFVRSYFNVLAFVRGSLIFSKAHR